MKFYVYFSFDIWENRLGAQFFVIFRPRNQFLLSGSKKMIYFVTIFRVFKAIYGLFYQNKPTISIMNFLCPFLIFSKFHPVNIPNFGKKSKKSQNLTFLAVKIDFFNTLFFEFLTKFPNFGLFLTFFRR